MTKKKYGVHRLDVKGKDVYNYLEQYLNDLEGEAISILPIIKKASLPKIYGITEKVDYLMIIEKIGN